MVGIEFCLFLENNHCSNIKKRLLLRCIHHFKSDLIYNLDHMRISGTEPCSNVYFGRTTESMVCTINSFHDLNSLLFPHVRNRYTPLDMAFRVLCC